MIQGQSLETLCEDPMYRLVRAMAGRGGAVHDVAVDEFRDDVLGIGRASAVSKEEEFVSRLGRLWETRLMTSRSFERVFPEKAALTSELSLKPLLNKLVHLFRHSLILQFFRCQETLRALLRTASCPDVIGMSVQNPFFSAPLKGVQRICGGKGWISTRYSGRKPSL